MSTDSLLRNILKPRLDDVRCKLEFRAHEVEEAFHKAVEREGRVVELEDGVSRSFEEVNMYNKVVVPLQVQADKIKQLVPEYQDIDLRLTSLSRGLHQVTCLSPLVSKSKMKLRRMKEDEEKEEPKGGISLRIQDLKSQCVLLKNALMEWDGRVNQVGGMIDSLKEMQEKMNKGAHKITSHLPNHPSLHPIQCLEEDVEMLEDVVKLEDVEMLEDVVMLRWQPLLQRCKRHLDPVSNILLNKKSLKMRENLKELRLKWERSMVMCQEKDGGRSLNEERRSLMEDRRSLKEKGRSLEDRRSLMEGKLEKLKRHIDGYNQSLSEVSHMSQRCHGDVIKQLQQLKLIRTQVEVDEKLYGDVDEEFQKDSARSVVRGTKEEKEEEMMMMKTEKMKKMEEWTHLKQTLDAKERMLEDLLEKYEHNSSEVDFLLQVESKLDEKVMMGDVDFVTQQLQQHQELTSELSERISTWKSDTKMGGDDLEELIERVEEKVAFKLQSLQTSLDVTTSFSRTAEKLVKLLNELDQFLAQHVDVCVPLLFERYDKEQRESEEEFERCVRDGGLMVDGGEDELKEWLWKFDSRWKDVRGLMERRGKEIKKKVDEMKRMNGEMDELMGWLDETETRLGGMQEVEVEENLPVLEQLLQDFELLEGEIEGKQDLMKKLLQMNNTNERVSELREKWKRVWLMVMERRRRLQDVADRLNEIEYMKNFRVEDWLESWMTHMNNNTNNVISFFRKLDRSGSGRIRREDFVAAVVNSNFSTSYLEVEAVADLFDHNDYINYKQFANSLKNDEQQESKTCSDVIWSEMEKEKGGCRCSNKYTINMVEEGKYRFGEAQKLRLVRTQHKSVMVRVGGGWMSLQEFLLKNDPCRKNITPELKDRYLLADGSNQSMAFFKPRPFTARQNKSHVTDCMKMDKEDTCGSVTSDQETNKILNSSFRHIDDASSQEATRSSDSYSNISEESSRRQNQRFNFNE